MKQFTKKELEAYQNSCKMLEALPENSLYHSIKSFIDTEYLETNREFIELEDFIQDSLELCTKETQEQKSSPSALQNQLRVFLENQKNTYQKELEARTTITQTAKSKQAPPLEELIELPYLINKGLEKCLPIKQAIVKDYYGLGTQDNYTVKELCAKYHRSGTTIYKHIRQSLAILQNNKIFTNYDNNAFYEAAFPYTAYQRFILTEYYDYCNQKNIKFDRDIVLRYFLYKEPSYTLKKFYIELSNTKIPLLIREEQLLFLADFQNLLTRLKIAQAHQHQFGFFVDSWYNNVGLGVKKR